MEDDCEGGAVAEHNRIKLQQMLVNCKAKPHSLQRLPPSFLQFLTIKGVSPKELAINIPRYVRTKTSLQLDSQQLAQQLQITTQQIVTLGQHFFALNPQAKINQCPLYQAGQLYGMDYSSSVPVQCLGVSLQDRVLELCCAPGNKSMLIADMCPSAKITGVEISLNRASTMKSIIKKYGFQKQIQVIVGDGLTFDSTEPFDRVLVDAECTHEGSLKHIFKFFKQEAAKEGKEVVRKGDQELSRQQEKQFRKNNSNPYTSVISKANQWTAEDFQQRFLDPYKLAQLNQLQSGLIRNGFRLLKEGGTLVYSTCSFDRQQNEDIIQNFLEQHPKAHLLNAGEQLECRVPWKQGTLKGTIRLSPSVSYCGGMFVAKIRKEP